MALRPWMSHLVGVIVATLVAAVLLRTLIPYLFDMFFPTTFRDTGVRGVSILYLGVALIPVVLWLLPPFLRFLARATYRIHKAFVGRGGFYVRFLTRKSLRFRDTLLVALGPFALDLLVISELSYLISTPAAMADLARGRVLVPSLFLLAGLLTAFVPGHWLLDALDVRIVTPKKGRVSRVAELFERFFGPVGAIALLAAFVTMLHSVSYSYEEGLVSLALWAVRLFPPVLAAVALYRVVIQPSVVPGLERWCDVEGIPVVSSLETALESVRPRVPPSPSSRPKDLPAGGFARQP